MPSDICICRLGPQNSRLSRIRENQKQHINYFDAQIFAYYKYGNLILVILRKLIFRFYFYCLRLLKCSAVWLRSIKHASWFFVLQSSLTNIVSFDFPLNGSSQLQTRYILDHSMVRLTLLSLSLIFAIFPSCSKCFM